MGTKGYGVGGEGNVDWPCQNVFYEYELTGNTWTTKAAQPRIRCGGASAEVDGYAFGGQNGAQKKVDKYDISANSWTTKNDQPYDNSGRSRPPPLGGRIYSTGLKYDYAADVWTSWLGMYGGQVFKIGGYLYGTSGSSEAGKYDPSSDTWTAIATNPNNQSTACAFADDAQYGFIVQGWYSYPNPVNTNTRYDAAGNSWATRASHPNSYGYPASFYINGGGHAFTGCTAHECKSGNSGHARYDNAANSWTSKASYPQAMRLVAGFAVPDNFPPNAPTGLSVSET